MIKILLIIGCLCFLGSGLLYAQKRRRSAAQPMGECQCLAWLHGGAGYPDGRSAMLSQLNAKPQRLTSECVRAAQKEIQHYAGLLVATGRYTTPDGADGALFAVATHQWFLTTRAVAERHATNWSGNNSDPLDTQMGMYVFDPAKFDLAMRSWHTNVFMEKGSDIVHAPDIVFDKSVVGFISFIVTDQDRDGDDCKTHRAKLEAERVTREAKGEAIQTESLTGTGTWVISPKPYVAPPKPQPASVIEFIDAHTIRLSRKATSCKDGWAAMFVPPEWLMMRQGW